MEIEGLRYQAGLIEPSTEDQLVERLRELSFQTIKMIP